MGLKKLSDHQCFKLAQQNPTGLLEEAAAAAAAATSVGQENSSKMSVWEQEQAQD